MSTEIVRILFAESGSRIVVAAMKSLAIEARKVQPAIDSLRAGFAALFSTATFATLGKMADDILRLRNRLTFVTGSAENAASVFNQLAASANATRTSLGVTGDLYTRFALATRHMGLNAQEVIGIVETLNRTVILSGANAREAEAGLLQFSQGLASNRLAGDELRAVLEQLPMLADIIGKELGVQRGALRFLAREGEIDGEVVVRALQKFEEESKRLAANMLPTIGQAFTVLGNNVMLFLNEVDKGTGLFEAISNGILYLSKNIDFLARIVIGSALVAAVYTAVTALKLLMVVLVSNPIGAILTGILVGASALIAFSDKIKVFGSETVTLLDALRAGVDVLTPMVISLFESISDFFMREIWPFIKEAPAMFLEAAITTVRFLLKIADTTYTYFSRKIESLKIIWSRYKTYVSTGFTFISDTAGVFAETFVDVMGAAISTVTQKWDAAWGFISAIIKAQTEMMDAIASNNLTAVGLAGINGPIAVAAAFQRTQESSLEIAKREYQKNKADNVFADFDSELYKRTKRAFLDSAVDLGFSFGRLFADGFTDIFKATFVNAGPLESIFNMSTQILDRMTNGFMEKVKIRAEELSKERLERERKNKEARYLASFGAAGDGDKNLLSLSDVLTDRVRKRLADETDALANTNRERRVRNDLLAEENKLKSAGFKADPDFLLELESLIRVKEATESAYKAIDQYAASLGETARGYALVAQERIVVEQTINTLNAMFEVGALSAQQLNMELNKMEQHITLKAELFREIKDPAEDYQQQLAALADLEKDLTSEIEKGNAAVLRKKLLIESLRNGRSMSDGARRSLAQLELDYTDTAAQIEKVIVNAFSSAEDALTNFVMTGKMQFSDLAKSIAEDLVRMGIQKFFLAPFAGGFSSLAEGGSFLAGFSGARAGGGPVSAGGTYLVGERGPEILQLGSSGGRVYSNEDSAQMVQGRGSVTNITMVVNTPDANSFRRSESQIVSGLNRRMRANRRR
jgi:tape measure domain-containing protein